MVLLKRTHHHRKMINRLALYIWLGLVMLTTSVTSSVTSSESQDNSTSTAPKEVVCANVDIRNTVSQFYKLSRCTVVEGYVQILLIDNASTEDFENLTFPLLREITDYLFLYRVQGLTSLSKLFPNLAAIKGQILFHNYALVIFEMMSMHDIGLVSLTAIQRGSVRIEKNPHLCYVENIDWDLIARAGQRGHFIKDNVQYEKCPNACPSRCATNNLYDGKQVKLCWNSQTCQKICSPLCEHQNLTCSSEHKCCHRECLGGCTGPYTEDCIACRHVSFSGRCVPKCPQNTFEFLGRRCILESECRKRRKVVKNAKSQWYFWKPFQGECLPECPAGFMESLDDPHVCLVCKDKCPKVCEGGIIESVANAQRLKGCTYIENSLEILIQGGDNVIKELETSLSSIKEIQGHLKIARSFPLISLNFLKDLQIIHGGKNEYTLIVLDNQNLQELWDWKTREKKLEIRGGKVFFHFNSKLCPNKIEELKEHAIVQDWDMRDVSPSSNGDRVACNVMKVDIQVWGIKCEVAGLSWINFRKYADFDFRSLLGYVVYYREAPDRNVTKFDGRDACGSDMWKVDDVEALADDDASNEVMTIIPRLKPYTTYAAYMRTYTITSASVGAESDIIYFTTKPYTPSQPVNVRARPTGLGEVVVSWDKPKRPNGNVTHYIVEGIREKDFSEFVSQRDYCIEPLILPRTKKTSFDDNLISHKNFYFDPSSTTIPNNTDNENCCSCTKPTSSLEIQETDAEFQIDFEDFLHNQVYIKNPDPNFAKSKKVSSGKKSKSKSTASPKTTVSPFSSVTTVTTKVPSLPSSQTTTERPFINKTRHPSERNDFKFREIISEGTYMVIRNLHHFTEYTIEVRACQDQQNATCDNASECSTQAITIVRTLPMAGADDIDSDSIVINTDNITIGIISFKWDEPKSPNGLIVSYQIEHKVADTHDYKPIPECITQMEYTRKMGYSLHDLRPGNYSLRLRATSLAGAGNWTKPKYFFIPEKNGGISSGIIAVLVIVVILAIVALSGLGVYIIKRKGFRVPDGILYASVNPEYISAGLVYEPDEWEVPREKIKILSELGQGSFGMVYRGEAKGLPNFTTVVPCAIKTVNETASVRERIEFLQEASVMKAFNCHHIVKLLGVVSRGHPTLVIMELMNKGDLKAYLRSHRPDREDLDAQPPTYKDILQMAAEIADGMAYLSAKKFVHRDLAARNCMVAEDTTVKIGDFGMTRDIYETDYYRKGGKGLLPVRWMAPECLKDGVFSCQSDIWSYGVVLWEMATFASQPYQGLANEQVLNYVISGHKMEEPENCPEMLYALMKLCWEFKPKARPTFTEIIEMLLPGINESKFNSVSFYHSHKQELMAKETESANDVSTSTPLRNCVMEVPIASREESDDEIDIHFFPATRDVSQNNTTSVSFLPHDSRNDFDLTEVGDHGAAGGSGANNRDYNIHSNESSKGMSVNSSDGSKGSNVSKMSNGSLANGHVTFTLGRTTTC